MFVFSFVTGHWQAKLSDFLISFGLLCIIQLLFPFPSSSPMLYDFLSKFYSILFYFYTATFVDLSNRPFYYGNRVTERANCHFMHVLRITRFFYICIPVLSSHVWLDGIDEAVYSMSSLDDEAVCLQHVLFG